MPYAWLCDTNFEPQTVLFHFAFNISICQCSTKTCTRNLVRAINVLSELLCQAACHYCLTLLRTAQHFVVTKTLVGFSQEFNITISRLFTSWSITWIRTSDRFCIFQVSGSCKMIEWCFNIFCLLSELIVQETIYMQMTTIFYYHFLQSTLLQRTTRTPRLKVWCEAMATLQSVT